MLDFIPIKDYYLYYYQFYLIIITFVVLNSFFYTFKDKKHLGILSLLGYISLIFTVLYIGLRPIDGVFVDMTIYAYMFERFQQNDPTIFTEDYGFYYFLEFCTKIMNVETFFLLCSFLYVVPLYFLSKKLFKEHWFYSFLLLCVSFSFWAYGTNGIRNGLATTFFLFAISYREKRWFSILLILISCSFHQTLILPTLAYILSFFLKSTRAFLLFWMLTIPISLFLGNYFVNLVETLGLGSEKVGAYFTEDISTDITKTGFRWDFLIYSSSAVFAGWFYIFKKKVNDLFYLQLFNVFLFSNAVWILIIRVNFSNRFAYLSWFMMALIIFYPILKYKILKNQNAKIGLISLFYFAFTYFMNVILTN